MQLYRHICFRMTFSSHLYVWMYLRCVVLADCDSEAAKKRKQRIKMMNDDGWVKNIKKNTKCERKLKHNLEKKTQARSAHSHQTKTIRFHLCARAHVSLCAVFSVCSVFKLFSHHIRKWSPLFLVCASVYARANKQCEQWFVAVVVRKFIYSVSV